ncbi:MAG: ZPR1 zinc finger domain-containing protein [Candidatus Diapherotrites archaeon]|nr:ZPR1 zinc finger domain-containing protein [Candidatus Diapherotrites archaeon]
MQGFSCPSCSNKGVLVQVAQNIPLFGHLVIQTFSCKHCGFKLNDVMEAEFHAPTRLEVRVNGKEDLNVKIVRNSSATIEIPELGAKVEPGPASMGFYTNAEGLLERVGDALNVLLNSAKGKELDTAVKVLEDLSQCRQGKKPFTVVLWDPYGNSKLLGSRVVERPLSEEETRNLKKSVQLFESEKK